MQEPIKVEDIRFTSFTDGKLRVWFKMIDVGHDGFMSREDFLSIADRFVKQYKLENDKASEIRDWLVDGWRFELNMDKEKEAMDVMLHKMSLVVALGSNLRAGRHISEDDFVKAYKQLIIEYPHVAKESLEKMVGAFFEVFDQDGDCYITDSEMTLAMRCFGYSDPELVRATFAYMDWDHDGRLSRQEYVGGWVNFLLGQEKGNPFVQAFAPHL